MQNARKMGINELLEIYKRTQQSTIDAQRASKEAQEEEEQRRMAEPDVPQASRGSAPRPLTMQEQMLEVAKEQEAEKKFGVARFRVQRHVCPNPQCQDPLA